jgi:hypothetical protein
LESNGALKLSGVDVTNNQDILVANIGNLVYTPNQDGNGIGFDEFDFRVYDGHQRSLQHTFTINVNAKNDPPDAVNDTKLTNGALETDEASKILGIAVLANDTDPDVGDTLSVISFNTAGTTGLVTKSGNTFDYDPNDQFESLGVGQSATDSFTYTISDGNGLTDTATVTVTINGLNDDPVAQDDDFIVDVATTSNLFNVFNDNGNGVDSDIDGDAFTVVSATGQATSAVAGPTVLTTANGGSVTIDTDGSIDYDPTGATASTDSFTYTISDGNGGQDTATVNFDLACLVTTLNDVVDAFDGLTSLREAITCSQMRAGDDIIRFEDSLLGGTIVLNSTLDVSLYTPTQAQGGVNLGDDLLIVGDNITIDTNGHSTGIHVFAGVFNAVNVQGDLTMQGFNIVDNSAGSTTNVAIDSAGQLGNDFTMIYDNITINGFDGTGMEVDLGSEVEIKNSTISNNVTGVDIQGSNFDAPVVTISDSIIENNDGGNGGVYADSGHVTLAVNNSIIRDNDSSTTGAGIHTTGSATSTVTVSNSWIDNNTNTSGTAGVFAANLVMSDSTVSNNTGATFAGIQLSSGGQYDITNSTISGNVGTTDNGALSALGGATGQLLNSTIVENSSGGGSLISVSTGLIEGNIVANNIGGNNGAGGAKNFVGNTTDVSSVLADNGGTTALPGGGFAPTHAITTYNENIIDAGSTTFTDDQRGFTTVDADGDGLAERDYGAYEYGANDPNVNDGAFAIRDLIVWDQTAIQPFNVLNNNGFGADFDPEGDTITVATTGTFATDQGGSVTLAANGNATYNPAGATSTIDTFTYTLNNGTSAQVTLDSQNIIVDTLADGTPGGAMSLREAITLSNVTGGTQTIYFDANLNTNEILVTLGELSITADVIIQGNGAANTIIDGNEASRIFNISSGNVTLQNLTLRDGNDTGGGGAITSNNSDLTLNDVTLTSNTASTGSGGALEFTNGNLNINDSNILGNETTAGTGGGIFLGTGSDTIVIDNTIIDGNKAQGNGSLGGGINIVETSATALDLTIQNSILDNNQAEDRGGNALAVFTNALADSIYIINTRFDSNTDITSGINTGHRGGGAILIDNNSGSFNQGQMDIENSTFSNNSHPDGGGAIAAPNDVAPTSQNGWMIDITNSTFSGNTTTGNGGAIMAEDGLSVDIANSTFYQNFASGTGDGIYVDNGATTILTSTVVYSESGGVGDSVVATGSGNVITTGGDNVFGVTVSGFTPLGTNTVVATNPGLAALADNGGTTVLPDGSYVNTNAITSGASILVDNGNRTNASGGNISEDQRGAIIFNPNVSTDIGAYEFGGTLPPVILDLNGDGINLISAAESNVVFDIYENNVLYKLGWVSGDDGILVFDADQNKGFSGIEEIDLTRYHADARTDLEGLKLAFDTNQDGVFDENDEKFEDFGVWQDKNEDGIQDEGEYNTLSALGISSISVESDNNSETIEGNTVHGYTTYEYVNGKVYTAADVGLEIGNKVVIDNPVIDSASVFGDIDELFIDEYVILNTPDYIPVTQTVDESLNYASLYTDDIAVDSTSNYNTQSMQDTTENTISDDLSL